MFAEREGLCPGHAGYRGVRWHVVGILIDLQGPAPPGTVGYSENLAKAGILARVGLYPRLALWSFGVSHRCLESSQGGQIFQCPWPDLMVPGSPGSPSNELSAFSAKALSHQQHQLLLAFVDLFEVVNELGKLQVAILGQQEGLSSLAQKLNELSVVARADVCQA